MSKSIFIMIGNSDDKLSQVEWAAFFRDTNLALRDEVERVHGQWVSEPASSWQNACWCVEVSNSRVFRVRQRLADLAAKYRQDSIAWAEATTEFIGAEVTA